MVGGGAGAWEVVGGGELTVVVRGGTEVREMVVVEEDTAEKKTPRGKKSCKKIIDP